MTQSATATMGGVFKPELDITFTGQTDFSNITLSTPTSKIGFATGSGGAVTQLTSKATAVTLNTPSGRITMHNASLATDTVVSFTLNNSTIAAGDILLMNHYSGGTVGSYVLGAQCAAGSAVINLTNFTGGSLSEAVVIAYVVFKAVNA